MRQVSSREFSEWMLYYQIEPFGEVRADLRAAMLAAVVANANRDAKKTKAFKITDFMLDFEKEKKPQSWQDQLAVVEAMNAAFGGKDERNL